MPALILLTLAVVLTAHAEGTPRFHIDQIIVEGQPADVVVPDEITMSVPLIYDAGAVKRAAYSLSRVMAENGYPYSKITTVAAQNNDDSAALTIRFRIDPDERVCNGQPVVTGIGKRHAMYHSDIRLVSGRLYNAADVDETLRRFSIRPYIREASAGSPVIIEDAPPCRSDNADTSAHGAAPTRAAVTPFAVVENRGMEVEGVLGYESGRGGESGVLSGRLDLSFMNMLRHGESMAASYAGTSVFQRLGLSASRPWMFGLPLELGGSMELEIEDEGYGYMSGEIWGAAEINARWKYGAALRGSETVPPDTIGDTYRYYGAAVFMYLIQMPWERGRQVWELSAKTGSGVANRERAYARSNMELTAGVHQPVRARYAAAVRVCAASLFTEEEYLPPAEQYRIGGHGSLRGYSEDEFAFRSAVYSQLEGLYYFNRAGAVFIFMDGGVGFPSSERLMLSESVRMFGYGAGLRFPSRLGTVSVEWARNIDDGRGLGRVHVGVKAVM